MFFLTRRLARIVSSMPTWFSQLDADTGFPERHLTLDSDGSLSFILLTRRLDVLTSAQVLQYTAISLV